MVDIRNTGQTFVTSSLLKFLFEKWSSLKEKNLLPLGANFLLLK